MPKPFNTSTPLGQLMVRDGYSVNSLAHASGVNVRMLSDYLASRRTLSARHMAKFSDLFDVSRDVLLGVVEMDQPEPVERVVELPVDQLHRELQRVLGGAR